MPERLPACAAWQEHLAGWVVAQLGPEDEAAWLVHLASCPTCTGEANSLLGVAAVSLSAEPGGEPWTVSGDDVPPPDLADRIVDRVETERRTSGLRRTAVALVGVAAAIALIVVLSRDDTPPLDGEPVTFARLAPGVEADAIVAPADGGSLVELTGRGLDPDVTYALWLTPPGGGYSERVPAGTFHPDDAGTIHVVLRSALPADEMGRVWATTPDGDIALDTEA